MAVPTLPQGTSPEDAIPLQRRLVEALLRGRTARTTIHWYYTPMALAVAGHLPADLRVYDCMDELSAFRGAPPAMLEMERTLFAVADLVFTGGRSLYEAKRDRHPDTHLFPSSIDVAHFGRARAGGGDPADQRPIPRPRLGWFGVIDERLDLELLARVAALRPDWQLVMIGPTAKIDPATLPRAANIHWLGPRPYAELPRYLSGWDVGLMPFARNPSTRFISPTKTPEYLAAGVPVVSTPIADVVHPYGQAGLVEIAASAAAVTEAVARMLERPRDGWLAAADRHLSGLSWDRTWAEMQQLMRLRLATRSSAATATAARHRKRQPCSTG